MTTERRGAPARDGARTAVASVVTGILMTGPVALVLGIVSLVARPAAAVRRLAVVGCVLGVLGTAAWGLWAVSVQAETMVAVAAPAPTPVRLALPSTIAAQDTVLPDIVPESGSEAADDEKAEPARATAPAGSEPGDEPDDLSDVPLLSVGTGLVQNLPVRIGSYATQGWTVAPGEGHTETITATFARKETSIVVIVTLHPTATDAEASSAVIVRERLGSPDATEGKELTSGEGARVRRVVHDGRTTFVWSEFTASIEVDGPSKAARVFVDRFVLGPQDQEGEQAR